MAAFLSISQAELNRRLAMVRRSLTEQGLDALVQFGAVRNFYLTGFSHSATERPIAIIVPVNGDIAALAPHLEEEHLLERVPLVKRLKIYPEYPDYKHPMLYLADLLNELGLASARLGVDADGYGGTYGYRGPALSAVVPDAKLTNVRDMVDDIKRIKSAEEIALIRACVPWGNYVVRWIQEHVRPGMNELTPSLQAMAEASAALIRYYGTAYRGKDNGSIPVRGGFVGGPKTALPHPIDDARPLQRGNVLIPWGSGEIGGYHSELERTMFLGPPSEEARRVFDFMLGAQEAGFATIKPGVPCKVVNDAVRSCLQKSGVAHLARHHTGHGLGLEIHEAPFLDSGDETVLQPGMVFSCEPGLYVQGLGGFRHSDTVIVTEAGSEVLTDYPRDIEAMTIPL